MTATAVKDLPILFSGPMVRAILEGRKTQTRRVMKQQPPSSYTKLCGPEWYEPTVVGRDGESRPGKPIFGVYTDDGEWGCKCPYWPGMRLWVKEAFYVDVMPWAGGGSLEEINRVEALENIYYRADGECCYQIPECACAEVGKPKWRSGRFMPRWASRITLEVTEVRGQRVREISGEDAKAEGVDSLAIDGFEYAAQTRYDYRLGFSQLWDSINGKSHPWSLNPWVWAISFRKVEK